jgi:hypothetical protein
MPRDGLARDVPCTDRDKLERRLLALVRVGRHAFYKKYQQRPQCRKKRQGLAIANPNEIRLLRPD